MELFASEIKHPVDVFDLLICHYFDWYPTNSTESEVRRHLQRLDLVSQVSPYPEITEEIMALLIRLSPRVPEPLSQLQHLIRARKSILETGRIASSDDSDSESEENTPTSSTSQPSTSQPSQPSQSSPPQLSTPQSTKSSQLRNGRPPWRFCFPFVDKSSPSLTILIYMGIDVTTSYQGKHLSDRFPLLSIHQWCQILKRGYPLVSSTYQHDPLNSLIDSLQEGDLDPTLLIEFQAVIRKALSSIPSDVSPIPGDAIASIPESAYKNGLRVYVSEYVNRFKILPPSHRHKYRQLADMHHRLQAAIEAVRIFTTNADKDWVEIIDVARNLGMIDLSSDPLLAIQNVYEHSLSLIEELDASRSTTNWTSVIALAQTFGLDFVETNLAEALASLRDGALRFYYSTSIKSWELIIELANNTGMIEMSDDPVTAVHEIAEYMMTSEFIDKWNIEGI